MSYLIFLWENELPNFVKMSVCFYIYIVEKLSGSYMSEVSLHIYYNVLKTYFQAIPYDAYMYIKFYRLMIEVWTICTWKEIFHDLYINILGHE